MVDHEPPAAHCTPQISDETSTAWLDSPEARQAKRLAGWPDCTTAEFLHHLINVLDAIEAGAAALEAELAERGLTYGEFSKMVADMAAENAQSTATGPAERYAIRRMSLGGFTPEQVAGILNLPPDDVEDYVRRYPMVTNGRELIRLHNEGKGVKAIARELGVDHKGVRRALVTLGLEPNVTRTYLTGEQRADIVGLYKQGWSYTKIAKRVKCERSKIANVLRAEHKAGRLPEYGSKSPTALLRGVS